MREGKLDETLFAKGMKQLALCRPQQERNLSPADVALRAEAYYEALGHELSDDEWVFAVREANREQTFFPSPVELLEYGRLYRASPPVGSARLLTDAEAEERMRMTPEQQENLQRGLQRIRVEVAAAGRPGLLPPARVGGLQSVGQVLQELGTEQRSEVNELAEKVSTATKV